MTCRGLTAGNFAISAGAWQDDTHYIKRLARIFQVQRRNQGVVVSGNGIFVLAEACDVAGDGVLGHISRFLESAAIGDAPWERRHKRGVAAFGFGAEHDVIAIVSLWHD
jgi:hypothetical protein